MGNVKIDLSYMDLFKVLKVDEKNKDISSNILSMYESYLNTLDDLGNKKENFVNRILFDEVLSIGNISNSQMDDLFDVLDNKTDSNKELHKINEILSGIENNQSAIGIRNKNNYVGAYDYENDCSIVKFENIDIEHINSIMEEIMYLYSKKGECAEDVIIKPIIISAMISLFQCFNDGNTRTSNLARSIKFWRDTNHFFGTKIEMPILYNYTLNTNKDNIRDMRNLVIDIAINKNIDSLNDYINKSLVLMENEINYQVNNALNYKNR